VVHIASSTPVRLVRWTPDTGAWDLACLSPCDKAVPLEGVFRITGDDVRPTPTFELSGFAPRGRIVLRVEPHARSTRTVGVLGIVLGSAAMVVALVGYAFADMAKNFHPLGSSTAHEYPDAAPYAATAIIGAVVAFGGIVAVVSNPASEVNSPNVRQPGDGAPPPVRRPDQPLDAAALRPPPAMMFPVLRVAF
jgi:hypothetical protein